VESRKDKPVQFLGIKLDPKEIFKDSKKTVESKT
jgi:hypothetical protein